MNPILKFCFSKPRKIYKNINGGGMRPIDAHWDKVSNKNGGAHDQLRWMKIFRQNMHIATCYLFDSL